MAVDKEIKKLIKRAIREDLGRFDVTTLVVVAPAIRVKAKIIAKQELVLCGLPLCREVFRQVDKNIRFKSLRKEGSFIKKGQTIVSLEGRACSILKAERLALNFLTHLSGIATKVREFTKIARRHKVKILDTRKTMPNLRSIQKYAVRVGGGFNHRRGLWDEVMIKENHLLSAGIKTRTRLFGDKLRDVVKKVKESTGKKVEVEVESLKEFKIACKCGPDMILLDNFTPKDVARAVELRNRDFAGIKLEASGGINIGNIREFAETRVDYISIGSLTHSPQAKDISLEII